MRSSFLFRSAGVISILSLASLLDGCGPGKPAETETIQNEGPEDEILSVSLGWQAPEQSRGFRDPPSPISVFETHKQSTISFKRGQSSAKEQIVVDESFHMRDGTTFECHTERAVTVSLAYARHAQEPAVEINQPALTLPRQCNRSGFPEPEIHIDAVRARFVLRSEQLVGYDPPLEKRVFLPVE